MFGMDVNPLLGHVGDVCPLLLRVTLPWGVIWSLLWQLRRLTGLLLGVRVTGGLSREGGAGEGLTYGYFRKTTRRQEKRLLLCVNS
jgi:hypothetical protein